MEGSGVEILKDDMYLVSATSRFSRISSRSSMRSAKLWVSLGNVVHQRPEISVLHTLLPYSEQTLDVNLEY
jgi:hypothetical protein